MKLQMNRKKLAALVMAALICVVVAGCQAAPAANEAPTAAAPTEAPTPSPTPKVGIEAVFDKPVSLAVVSNGDEASSALFFEAAVREAESMGVTVTTNAAEDGFDTAVAEAAQSADAVVAFLPNKAQGYSALESLEKPTALYELSNGSVPQGLSHLYYESDGELDMALNAALVYPPHDTPVRLILMFKSADSPAYAAYKALYDQGMIFPKEIYIASEEEKEAGEWLTGKLDSFVEGMLDAVFAEDAALASSAYDALAALGRTDMEVFCPGVTADVVTRMQQEPDVFAQGIGQNDALAGMLSVRAALQMLKGGEAVTLAFESAVINAEGFGTDAATLAMMDSEKAALYNADWMDELRAYYGAGDASEGS